MEMEEFGKELVAVHQLEAEGMTVEAAYIRATDLVYTSLREVRRKLDEGVNPVEIANRLTLGMDQDPLTRAAAPGLYAVALTIMAERERLGDDL